MGSILTSVIQMDRLPRSYKKPWRQSKLFSVLEMIHHLYFNIYSANKSRDYLYKLLPMKMIPNSWHTSVED